MSSVSRSSSCSSFVVISDGNSSDDDTNVNKKNDDIEMVPEHPVNNNDLDPQKVPEQSAAPDKDEPQQEKCRFLCFRC